MKHPIKSDSRYSIALEFTGHLSGKPRHVLRFAGERIDDYGSYSAAVVRAVGHKSARDGALIVTEITTLCQYCKQPCAPCTDKKPCAKKAIDQGHKK